MAVKKDTNNYESLIRWSAKDSKRLEQAVSHFNSELSKIENKENLPPKVKYDQLKYRIVTRKELNIIVNSLNRANENNLTKRKELASGERVTAWEYDDAIRRKNIAASNLLEELNRINEERGKTGNMYMGQERITEIQETLNILDETLEDLDSFKSNRRRLRTLGRTDYETFRNKIFRENVMYALREGTSNFDNYDKLMKELNQIRNPNKFYEYIKKSSILMDIFLWYKDPDGTKVYSKFETNEQAFDYAVKDELGIKIAEE